MKLKIKLMYPGVEAPKYASDGASAFDLVAHSVRGARTLGSFTDQGRTLMIGTGIAVEVPPGWVLLLNSRSGHGARHQVRLANCQGWIDSDYRGEIMVALTSDNPDEDGGLFVRPGDRIAQAMLVQAPRVEFDVADDLSDTRRGDAGFGSTGA